jgi:hypothetical protein
MILSIRDQLLESDFSMCLAYLLNYEQPEDPSAIISIGIAIRKEIFNIEETKDDELGLGFEDLDVEKELMTNP